MGVCVDTDLSTASPELDSPSELISSQTCEVHVPDASNRFPFSGEQEALIKSELRVLPQEHIALIYESVRPALYASLRQHRLANEDIEDIIQETFLRLIDRFPGNPLADKARSWLFRVAYNLAIDLLRSGWKSASDTQTDRDDVMSLLADNRLNPEETYLFAERKQRLQKDLAMLSSRQRLAISLRIAGLSCMEIARLLKSTPHSVEELIRRGSKRLRSVCREGNRLAASSKLSPCFITD